jgi:hypothetical protein
VAVDATPGADASPKETPDTRGRRRLRALADRGDQLADGGDDKLAQTTRLVR